MNKRTQLIIGVSIALGFAVIVGVVKFFQIRAAIAQSANFAPPPEMVTATIVAESEWQKTLYATASLAAVQGVTLRAELSGTISKINFQSGDEVKAGHILVELDTTVEEANLQGAIAIAEQTSQNLTRARALREKKANSVAEFDDAAAKSREARAAVDSLKAIIARKRIIAPFDGKAGIRMVNLGQYVASGDEIVPLFDEELLYVNFSLPQQEVARVGLNQSVLVKVDAFPDKVFTASLSAINPNIDPSTRNVAVQATLPNKDGTLRSGMFAKAEVVLPEIQKVIAVPASSISYAPYGDAVYIIEQMKDPKGADYLGVRQQFVKLGSSKGDQIAVISGLTAGAKVVTSGTFKLRPGAAVNVSENITPNSIVSANPADT